MIDVFQVADVFLQHAFHKHGRDIGIIAYYGSHALGNASPTSDLDLIYIPDDGKAAALVNCFVLDGILGNMHLAVKLDELREFIARCDPLPEETV